MSLVAKLSDATTLYLAVVIVVAAVTSAQTIYPDCQASCGDVPIPYPFGTNPRCYLNSRFLISCNATLDGSGRNVSKPFLWTSNIEVLGIKLDGELRMNTYIGRDCYNESGARDNPAIAIMRIPFAVSTTRNKFTAVGCDTLAFLNGVNGVGFSTGCLSLCNGIDSVTDGACNGIGCCQTAIPKNLMSYNVNVSSFNNHLSVWSFNPCSFSFIAEESAYQFLKTDLKNLGNRGVIPTVFDWDIQQETCDNARKNATTYACKDNSDCVDVVEVSAYRCNCSAGYEGNPYLGCTNINECSNSTLNDCEKICIDTPGNYTCTCPKGYHGDGRRGGDGCNADQSLVIKIVVGVGGSIIVMLLSVGFLYLGMKKRNLLMLKEKYFKQNGGILLQQQLHERGNQTTNTAARIFSAEELKAATNDFDDSRIVGRGGYGVVYKGFLPNGSAIAIKKSKLVDPNQIEQFINEVIILSQINHRNVVKLLGCCLETEVPLLVYEFVNNGTLFDHIHNKAKSSKVPWNARLRIAAETAGVLSYLHSAASVPIIHRDVKSTNILLDESYTAKVSDFGASRLVPLDQAQLSTMVQGTLGYLDPEYMHTSQLTEKSDVYSFSVVLVELMTGKKALSFDRPEEERSLVMYFLSCLEDDRLFEIVDEFIAEEGGNHEQLMEVANLARRCLRMKGEERPSMKEVAMELEGIRAMAGHPWVTIDLNPEEKVSLLDGGGKSSVGDDGLEPRRGGKLVGWGDESIASMTDSRNVGYSDSMRNCDMPSVSYGR